MDFKHSRHKLTQDWRCGRKATLPISKCPLACYPLRFYFYYACSSLFSIYYSLISILYPLSLLHGEKAVFIGRLCTHFSCLLCIDKESQNHKQRKKYERAIWFYQCTDRPAEQTETHTHGCLL